MHEMPYKVPTHFANMRIKFRVPYTIPGELIVPAGVTGRDFPEATFLHSVELPFEIWDMSIKGAQVDDNSIPIAPPAPSIFEFMRLTVQDLSKNQKLTRSSQLVSTLIDDDTGKWFWRVPYTIVRAEGFQVTCDNLLANNGLRFAVTFRGFLLVLMPPSETR